MRPPTGSRPRDGMRPSTRQFAFKSTYATRFSSTRKKDFEDPFRKITFRNAAEMCAVLVNPRRMALSSRSGRRRRFSAG